MLDFFKNKKVFITGHTGFKGTWLAKILVMAGADVIGYSLEAPTNPNIFQLSSIEKYIKSYIGDIRDREYLMHVIKEVNPEIVIHMAAQPLVRESYIDPVYTYETNVMGTVNILECVRNIDSVRSVLNVTTDKVYENKEWVYGYREVDNLDGYDPYSNSKSCSELVTHSYKKAFFDVHKLPLSTARAGNVIGGGDFSKDRIIPDCVRAASMNMEIEVRNPKSIRPYQYVIEPLSAYLLIVKSQYEDFSKSGFYNVGPDDEDCVSTGELVDVFCEKWGEGISWKNISVDGPHEANFLKLDCSKIKAKLQWKPKIHIEDAVSRVVEWSKSYTYGEDYNSIMEKQIKEYFYK